MIKLETQVPDTLYQQLASLADREAISMEQLVLMALSAQVSAWMTKDYWEERAKKGSWEQFQQVLAKVSEQEPEDYDRL
jgi:hypothetical protein